MTGNAQSMGRAGAGILLGVALAALATAAGSRSALAEVPRVPVTVSCPATVPGFSRAVVGSPSPAQYPPSDVLARASYDGPSRTLSCTYGKPVGAVTIPVTLQGRNCTAQGTTVICQGGTGCQFPAGLEAATTTPLGGWTAQYPPYHVSGITFSTSAASTVATASYWDPALPYVTLTTVVPTNLTACTLTDAVHGVVTCTPPSIAVPAKP